MMKSKIMQVANLLFGIVFILSAALQYNDPDPVIWIMLYLYSAILCILAFRNRFYPAAYILGIVVYSIYAVYLFLVKDGVADWLSMHDAETITGSMKAEKPWIEATREFFGLFIMIISLALNYFYAGRLKNKL